MLVQLRHNYKQQTCTCPSFGNLATELKNFQKVDDYLWRGAKPTIQQLQELKRQGVKVVISFRTGYQGNEFDEAQVVKHLGMNYVHLPFISWNNPPTEYIDKFFGTIEKAKANKEKVFIHCTHGKDRTGLFSAMYKLKYSLDNIDNCISEMFQFGHDAKENPNLIPFLRNYANNLTGTNK